MTFGIEMSLQELLELPVSVDLETAGRAFGLGRTKSFELAQADEFPCRVLRVGIKYRVPRSALLEALGYDPAIAVGVTPDAGASPAPTSAPAARAARRHRGSTRARADASNDAAAAVG